MVPLLRRHMNNRPNPNTIIQYIDHYNMQAVIDILLDRNTRDEVRVFTLRQLINAFSNDENAVYEFMRVDIVSLHTYLRDSGNRLVDQLWDQVCDFFDEVLLR